MIFTRGTQLLTAMFRVTLSMIRRLQFNSLDSSFVRLSDLEIQTLLTFCDDHKQCLACGFKERKSNFTNSRAIRDGFSHNDVNYHVGDFAYISTGYNSIYQIGQIEKFKFSKGKCVEIVTRAFGRYDDVVRKVCRGVDKPKGVPYDQVRALHLYIGLSLIIFCSGVCSVLLFWRKQGCTIFEDHVLSFMKQRTLILTLGSLTMTTTT